MEDKYLWLEEVEGSEALSWVNDRNTITEKYFEQIDSFKKDTEDALAIYNDKDKLLSVNFVGDYVFNYFSDENNNIGLLRRMLVSDFNQKKTNWELVIDFDILSAAENKKWVYQGLVAAPNKKRAIIFISDGGKDEYVTRELDLDTLQFVEKNPFNFTPSKGWLDYLDNDRVICTHVVNEDDNNRSGYPRRVRIVNRGEHINNSNAIYEADKGGAFCYPFVCDDQAFILDRSSFFEGKLLQIKKQGILELEVPPRHTFYGVVSGFLIISINEDWDGFYSGDLLAVQYDDLGKVKDSKLIYHPKDRESFEYSYVAKDKVILILDRDIRGNLLEFNFDSESETWRCTEITFEKELNITAVISSEDRNDYYFYSSSFNSPTTLSYKDEKGISNIQFGSSFFDYDDVVVNQEYAKSKDGTMVPYFIMHKKDVVYDGTNKTIQYGYGGFEIALKPSFSNLTGKLWLDKGYVYVVANIRGGGEFGPSWHQAALKHNRHKAYEDFFAVSEKLIEDKVTSPEHLGAWGGSNGGLLMGVCMTQRPDLYNAIICAVPLLDMLRYHKLLAGASWIGEYGDPEIEEDYEYLASYSPYQNLKVNDNFPKVLFKTSTKDDRVHPGHARKMVAKCIELGADSLYFENINGGHAGSSSNDEYAVDKAMAYSFFEINL
ncbi:prolyl oligopeptidase family protein [Bacteriovorax sp. Seq25_V]|uniref:prolyl oligopeptidase family serine peptidase n=1 Tax=Bacteriovorax sp. Seq25_V TaxID=1201288 RepID=UPI00038A4D97|nr:prolyl oligopeptidase family serine peptidase [Bacteriovorax sp. Seq25_V]EQC46802.1 peptidase, S9A/B/C family, catalytic domain protein [Bacteriovorax sp. Seq25_V]